MSVRMDRCRLWAKRCTDEGDIPDSAYLPGHLCDVHRSAQQVLDATARAQLDAVGLPHALWLERFRRVVTLAAALHDLGKCNDQFQGMLKAGGRQALRHEWVTLLIVDDPEWRDWLLPAVGGSVEDWAIVRWCIAGHHPGYDRSVPPELAQGPVRMRLPLNDDDMKAIIEWLGKAFGLNKPPKPMDRTIDLSVGADEALNDLYQRYYDDEDGYDNWPSDLRLFVAAAKDCLVAADVAGSALPREVTDETERSRWIAAVLDAGTLPNASAFGNIVQHHLAEKKEDPDREDREHFQRGVAQSTTRVTFVKAGCGTGKTVAAYRWAEARCAGRRLYVCYPTTGTATEGFRDYLLDPELAEHVKTNLEHGRRRVDFRLLQADEDRNTDIARIESLDLWRIPVMACTVDTVLGVVQNNRRGLFGWPALAQGGFVFDEIHSYDDKLFDALLHFLNAMRSARVLLMTASLPEHRRKAIEQALSERGETLVQIDGPVSLERRPRYQLREAKADEVVRLIGQELEGCGQVLRVCNTVGAAIREARALEDAGLSPILYHSRFKYFDRDEPGKEHGRVVQHQRVIDAFKQDGPALAVCTQVAEMSLDLSATLLVTDLAPVPSLIQRLGRLNRRAKDGDATRPFIVTDPLGADGKFSPLPYDADDLETARAWIRQLGNGDLSQADLAAAWEKLQDGRADVARYQSAWLDFGPATPVLELREGSPNVTVVLEQDWAALKAGTKRLAEVALPMPVPPAKRGDKRFEWQAGEFNGVPVAREDAIVYDPQRGATWATQDRKEVKRAEKRPRRRRR